MPGRSLGYLLGCFLALTLFAAIGVYPLHRQRLKVLGRNAGLEAALREHQALLPMHAELAALTRTALHPALARPGRTNLTKAQVPELPATFAAMARAAGVELCAVTPQVLPPRGEGNSLSVVTRVRGSFPALRAYLVGVGRHPAVRRMTRATIRKLDVGEELELESLMGVD